MKKIVLLIGVATMLAFGGSASAGRQPVVGTFSFTDEVNVDDGVSAICGFTVTETDAGRGSFEVFFDSTGTPVRLQVEEHYTGVFSANGLTVNTSGATLARFDLNGGETDAGLNIKVTLPGGGILYMDRGRLVFDDNGNLVSESGPHPSLHGDIDGLCAVLTP